jgi:hypothetical protein
MPLQYNRTPFVPLPLFVWTPRTPLCLRTHLPLPLSKRLSRTWLLPQMLDPIALSIDDAPASAPARTRPGRSPPALSPPLAKLIVVCCLEQDAGVDLGGGIRSHGSPADTAHAPPPRLSSFVAGTSTPRDLPPASVPVPPPEAAGAVSAGAGAGVGASPKNSEKMSLSSESASAKGNHRPPSSSCGTDAGASGAATAAAFSGLSGTFRWLWLCMTTWPLHQSSSMKSSSSLHQRKNTAESSLSFLPLRVTVSMDHESGGIIVVLTRAAWRCLPCCSNQGRTGLSLRWPTQHNHRSMRSRQSLRVQSELTLQEAGGTCMHGNSKHDLKNCCQPLCNCQWRKKKTVNNDVSCPSGGRRTEEEEEKEEAACEDREEVLGV